MEISVPFVIVVVAIVVEAESNDQSPPEPLKVTFWKAVEEASMVKPEAVPVKTVI